MYLKLIIYHIEEMADNTDTMNMNKGGAAAGSGTTETKNVKTFESWDDDVVTLNRHLLRGIYSYGFEKPSPIQKKSVIPMCDRVDLIAQAQSGTGKTGAFTVGTLQNVDSKLEATQALILSPTRELATQNFNVCKSIGQFMKMTIKLMIGGTSTEQDRDDLKTNVPHIIVATPGRLFDMLRRGYIKNDNIKLMVLDEADEMLSSGFKEQVYNIFQYMPSDIQVCLFSATMPPEVHALTDKFMRNPTKILVENDQLTLRGIQQYKILVENDHQKYGTMKDIFSSVAISQCIIYCNSVRRVQDLKDAMVQDGYPVICIHSNMPVEERKKNFLEFKSGKARVLVSSDITARGIDVQQVSVVINFDLCNNIHTYPHRPRS